MAKLNYRAKDRYGRGVGQIGPTSKDMLEDLQRDMQNRATSIGDIINIASTIISGVNLAQTVKEAGFKEALKEQFNPIFELDGKQIKLDPQDIYKEVDRKGIKSLLPDFRDFDERFKINEKLLEELEKNPELFKKLTSNTQAVVAKAQDTTKESILQSLQNIADETLIKQLKEKNPNYFEPLKELIGPKMEKDAYNPFPFNIFDEYPEGSFNLESLEDLS